MRDANDLFSASAASLWGTMISNGGVAGFRIPDYQRTYDWSTEKIGRLLEDCANSLTSLAHNDESHTFLGTLILVRERSEPAFDGVSLGVVDGQQRLTTLLIASCVLAEYLIELLPTVETLSPDTRRWLRSEVEFQLDQLSSCALGKLPGRGSSFPYPRLVRHVDNRAKSRRDAEYRSLIATFLMGFSDFYASESDTAPLELRTPRNDGEALRFKQNYEFIRAQLRHLARADGSSGEIDCEPIAPAQFARKGMRSLFDKLTALPNDAARNRALSEIASAGAHEAIVRAVLLSSYITQRVVLTRVETEDEDAAFDIFDALNTTGEPLTAVETFRPRIIQLSGPQSGSDLDETRAALEDLDEVLNLRFSSTEAKQSETKDAVVTFALYFDGSKESRELSAQRRYLRSRFDRLGDVHDRRRFVVALRDISMFRSRFWDRDAIRAATAHGQKSHIESLQLCFSLLNDMNTSLALPILARYWVSSETTGRIGEFAAATRAVTAFLVLRRAATGSTSGIDALFRSVMSQRTEHGDPLCIGTNFSNKLLDVKSLRALLRGLLRGANTGFNDKSDWVSLAGQTPVATASRPLSRFLLLAASTHTACEDPRNGMITRKDVRPSTETAYLTYENWISDAYRTVEHVAPDANPGTGWPTDIYKNPSTRHLLGNLTLLPQQENSRAGNRSWPAKRVFYSALAEKRETEQKRFLEEAEGLGFKFTSTTKKLLASGNRLHHLDSVRDVDAWDSVLILKRTENLLSLAWDHIEPWLMVEQ